MSTHTPGPWKAEFSNTGHCWVVEGAGLQEIAQEPLNSGVTHTESPLNARLVAAAPDLLTACRLALSNLDASLRGAKPPTNDLELAGVIRAAIAKATGGE